MHSYGLVVYWHLVICIPFDAIVYWHMHSHRHVLYWRLPIHTFLWTCSLLAYAYMLSLHGLIVRKCLLINYYYLCKVAHINIC